MTFRDIFMDSRVSEDTARENFPPVVVSPRAAAYFIFFFTFSHLQFLNPGQHFQVRLKQQQGI